MSELQPDDLVFLDPYSGNMYSVGGIGIFRPGFIGYEVSPPEFELFVELKEIAPIINYLHKQFPGGWEIKDGELTPQGGK